MGAAQKRIKGDLLEEQKRPRAHCLFAVNLPLWYNMSHKDLILFLFCGKFLTKT